MSYSSLSWQTLNQNSFHLSSSFDLKTCINVSSSFFCKPFDSTVVQTKWRMDRERQNNGSCYSSSSDHVIIDLDSYGCNNNNYKEKSQPLSSSGSVNSLCSNGNGNGFAAGVAIKYGVEIVRETWVHDGKTVKDFTLYTGVLGTAYLLFKSYQVTNNRDDLNLCVEIVQACETVSRGSAGRSVTFICGRAGVCALGAVTAKYIGDEKMVG